MALLLISLIVVIVIFTIMVIRNNYKKKYSKILDVSDLKSLQKHFYLDNPNSDGTDPTGGKVDYSYCFVNKVNPFEELKDCSLITEYNNGIKIDINRQLDANKKLGSVRLISKQAMKGGIFIFDVEHIPIGCGVWPAIWLNGFIGNPDQIFVPKTDPDYKKYQDKAFKCKDGKPSPWPTGGEIDIIEQTNFSNTNLLSVHGGPNCEIASVFNDKSMMFPAIKGTKNIRSCCGGDPCGKCGDNLNKFNRQECDCNVVNQAGNCQTKGPEGSFGYKFNLTQGGIYAMWWKNDELIYIYFWSLGKFSQNKLKQNGGPLSEYPNPSKWNSDQIVASYKLNDPKTTGCKLNYQNIIINITLCGGWAGAVFPSYCSVDNKSNCEDWINKCYDTKTTDLNPDGTAKNGCFDGFKLRDGPPVFLQEAYFKIRNIRVFQCENDLLLKSKIKENYYAHSYKTIVQHDNNSVSEYYNSNQQNNLSQYRLGNLRAAISSWKNIFSDDFKSLNSWKNFIGGDPTHSCVYYTNDKDVISYQSDGTESFLRIQPKRNNTSTQPKGGYKSGRLYSAKQFGPYGYFEAKIRLNNLSNMAWPAFWLTPQNVNGNSLCANNINCGEYGVWPRSGEIDIMETVNLLNKNFTTTHCGQDYLHDIAITNNTPIDFSKFNVFAVNWQPNVIDFYINAEMSSLGIKGTPVFSIPSDKLKVCADAIGSKSKTAPFDKPMNIILNAAVGGGFPLAMPNPPTACACMLNPDGSCNLNVPWENSCLCKGYNPKFSMDIAHVNVWEQS